MTQAPTLQRGPVQGSPAGTRRPGLSLRAREAITGLVFVSPQVLGFLAVVIVPMVAVVWYSLQDYSAFTGTATYIGAGNYRALADDPQLTTVIVNTVLFGVLLVPIGIVGAMGLAMLVNQHLPGIKVFRAFFFAPTLVSLVAWAIVWQLMLQQNGAVNGLLQLIGIEGPNWLRDQNIALLSVVLVQAIKGFGINMMIFLAALQSVPKEMIEAARIDGASSWVIARRMILPLISPEILMVSILMVIGAFKTFAQVLLLTNGGPGFSTTLLAFYIYQEAFSANDFGYAAALSLLLFVILLALTGAMWQLRKRVVFHES